MISSNESNILEVCPGIFKTPGHTFSLFFLYYEVAQPVDLTSVISCLLAHIISMDFQSDNERLQAGYIQFLLPERQYI